MNEIKFNDEIFAKIIDLNHLENGLNFFSNDDEFIQVGTWKYEKGKTLDKHYHNFFERKSYRTSEAVLVLNGEIECSIFTEENQFIWKGKLKKNQLIIQLQEHMNTLSLRTLKFLKLKMVHILVQKK